MCPQPKGGNPLPPRVCRQHGDVVLRVLGQHFEHRCEPSRATRAHCAYLIDVERVCVGKATPPVVGADVASVGRDWGLYALYIGVPSSLNVSSSSPFLGWVAGLRAQA